jgi:DNA-binding transcriptional regulator PaaX
VSPSLEARVSSREETQVPAALARLEADGWIERRGEAWRTSRRFQRAMARAAAALYEAGDQGDDLRVPIAIALLEGYEGKIHDEMLAELVDTMLPIELVSLGLVRR